MVNDDLSFMARHGARLVDNGYAVIPIMPGTKKPGQFRRGCWVDYPGWSRHCQRATTEHEIEVWSAWPEAAVAIACGTVVGIDIDIAADAEVAIDVERLARARLGDTPGAPDRLRTEAAAGLPRRDAIRRLQASADRGLGHRSAVRRLRHSPDDRQAVRLAGGVARRSPARMPCPSSTRSRRAPSSRRRTSVYRRRCARRRLARRRRSPPGRGRRPSSAAPPRRSPMPCATSPTPISTTTAGCGSAWP